MTVEGLGPKLVARNTELVIRKLVASLALQHEYRLETSEDGDIYLYMPGNHCFSFTAALTENINVDFSNKWEIMGIEILQDATFRSVNGI